VKRERNQKKQIAGRSMPSVGEVRGELRPALLHQARAGTRARAAASARRIRPGGCARTPPTPRAPAAASTRPMLWLAVPDHRIAPVNSSTSTKRPTARDTNKAQKRKTVQDAPTIRNEHPAQFPHPDAVPAKERVKRHRPPDVFQLSISRATPPPSLSVCRQQLR
jgi:hypothetical protein